MKFTLLSKYVPSFLSNPRDEMCRFMMCVFDLVDEKCRTTMLHDDMNISRLKVYAQSIEESKLNRKIMDSKISRFDDHGKPRF